MRKKLDTETVKMLTDGEEVASLIQGKGWAIVHGKLVERVTDLQNIGNLDLTKPDTINIQIAARVMAAQFIKDWLQNDVFGFVEQQEANREAFDDSVTEDYINR